MNAKANSRHSVGMIACLAVSELVVFVALQSRYDSNSDLADASSTKRICSVGISSRLWRSGEKTFFALDYGVYCDKEERSESKVRIRSQCLFSLTRCADVFGSEAVFV
ncbi:hypothetical protein C8J56DRAFT_162048 [Mycena floridula]|nr:hypothetical protein C8J56DRAFT_162048 [Mycena floridula]